MQNKYKIPIHQDLELWDQDLFWYVVNFIRNNKAVAQKIIDNIDNKYPYDINCSFPYSCNQFPCDSLNCNGDVCSNGHVYRMS